MTKGEPILISLDSTDLGEDETLTDRLRSLRTAYGPKDNENDQDIPNGSNTERDWLKTSCIIGEARTDEQRKGIEFYKVLHVEFCKSWDTLGFALSSTFNVQDDEARMYYIKQSNLTAR